MSLEKEIDFRHLPTAYGISRLPQLGLCDNCRLQMNKNMVWCLLAAMVTIQIEKGADLLTNDDLDDSEKEYQTRQ
ncbi:unnamed protein product [Rhizophagus irregularis]|uniref:Uncharacterized protein n=1 Tax=Rhizophagus irregularis TaxID=588596 RepID=A0A916EGE1_9GLOM|nr:unnamed protein product [Rhizophagus irregularis]CAB5386094.1 unnamed protein product [Rhizophagus irregularis]